MRGSRGFGAMGWIVSLNFGGRVLGFLIGFQLFFRYSWLIEMHWVILVCVSSFFPHPGGASFPEISVWNLSREERCF